MFPKTKIIFCERNFLDTALSCYFTKFDESELSWAFNLDNIITYFKIYTELKNHLIPILKNNVLTVKYETVN